MVAHRPVVGPEHVAAPPAPSGPHRLAPESGCRRAVRAIAWLVACSACGTSPRPGEVAPSRVPTSGTDVSLVGSGLVDAAGAVTALRRERDGAAWLAFRVDGRELAVAPLPAAPADAACGAPPARGVAWIAGSSAGAPALFVHADEPLFFERRGACWVPLAIAAPPRPQDDAIWIAAGGSLRDPLSLSLDVLDPALVGLDATLAPSGLVLEESAQAREIVAADPSLWGAPDAPLGGPDFPEVTPEDDRRTLRATRIAGPMGQLVGVVIEGEERGVYEPGTHVGWNERTTRLTLSFGPAGLQPRALEVTGELDSGQGGGTLRARMTHRSWWLAGPDGMLVRSHTHREHVDTGEFTGGEEGTSDEERLAIVTDDASIALWPSDGDLPMTRLAGEGLPLAKTVQGVELALDCAELRIRASGREQAIALIADDPTGGRCETVLEVSEAVGVLFVRASSELSWERTPQTVGRRAAQVVDLIVSPGAGGVLEASRVETRQHDHEEP